MTEEAAARRFRQLQAQIEAVQPETRLVEVNVPSADRRRHMGYALAVMAIGCAGAGWEALAESTRVLNVCIVLAGFVSLIVSGSQRRRLESVTDNLPRRVQLLVDSPHRFELDTQSGQLHVRVEGLPSSLVMRTPIQPSRFGASFQTAALDRRSRAHLERSVGVELSRGVLKLPKTAPQTTVDAWMRLCELVIGDPEAQLRALAKADDLSDAARAIAGLKVAGRSVDEVHTLVTVVGGLMRGALSVLTAYPDPIDQAMILEGVVLGAGEAVSSKLHSASRTILAALPETERGILSAIHLKCALDQSIDVELQKLQAVAGPATLEWLAGDTLPLSLTDRAQALREAALDSGQGTLSVTTDAVPGRLSESDTLHT